jgi:Uma2 family endonuclease
MAVETKLVTVSEFVTLPDPPNGRYELRNGEVVLVPPVKHLHTRIQLALLRYLMERLGHVGVVGMEYPFQPTNEYEFRYADVAFVSRERVCSTDDSGYLQGAPDLVVEILSRSNTWLEVEDKRELCLRSGCQSYWIVNPVRQTVQVTDFDHTVRTYTIDDAVPLATGASIPVRAIFEK